MKFLTMTKRISKTKKFIEESVCLFLLHIHNPYVRKGIIIIFKYHIENTNFEYIYFIIS